MSLELPMLREFRNRGSILPDFLFRSADTVSAGCFGTIEGTVFGSHQTDADGHADADIVENKGMFFNTVSPT
ncbi:hypothetical protein JYT87_01955 [Nitrospira defluvii]|nr:hypothetical protein [Nitrospira defluvii]